jgi:protein SCO1
MRFKTGGWLIGLAIIGIVMVASASTVGAGTTVLPVFELRDQHGKRFTQAELLAKPSVIHFGFTSCPVICPTTLYEVGARMRALGSIANEINFVFVTVDPQRDTAERLKTYIDSFDGRIVGLSGDIGQISALANWVGASFARIETAPGDYTMDHSLNAFLVARGGRATTPLYMGDNAKEQVVLDALRALAVGGA